LPGPLGETLVAILAAFRYFVFRFFTLYGVRGTELLAAATGIDFTR